jgi:glucans biosynthesis protein
MPSPQSFDQRCALFRRVLLGASASLPLLAIIAPANAADPVPQPAPFDGATVRNMARQLALQPYKVPESTLPAPFKNLDFDAYRSIRFDHAKSLWHGQGRKFTA